MRRGVVVAFVAGAGAGALGATLLGARAQTSGTASRDAVVGKGASAARDPVLETSHERRVVRLRTDLEEARARIATLEVEAAKSRPVPPAARKTAKPPKEELPKGIWPVAERVGAGREAVELAWRIRCGEVANRSEAVQTLKGYGEEGLRALIALMLGPRTAHTMLPPLIGELGVSGADEIIIGLIEASEEPTYLPAALGHLDSERSRDFLVAHLARSTDDPGQYWYTATALGRLHESRAAAGIDIKKIAGVEWGGVRGHILSAIGQMGGSEAAQRLIEYLRLPHADQLGAAISALAEIDKRAARDHARRILASDRAPFLTYVDRPALEKAAKQE